MSPAPTVLADLVALVDVASGRASYAEARWVDTEREDLVVRNGEVETVETHRSTGIGVRVRVRGAWGFAATRDLTRAGGEAALAQAIAIAEAQPAGDPRPLAPVAAPARGHWASPYEQDPFAVPLTTKLELLTAAGEALRSDPRIAVATASCTARRVSKAFASSDGAACTQELVSCGGGIQAIAVDGAEAQSRSYPMSHEGSIRQAGWEHLLAIDLPGNAARVGQEAIELLSAPPCPEGRFSLVLHPEQVALQIHESIGHALELDRIQLGEASYAGTSWVGGQDLAPGAAPLQYGSELLQITADATLPGGLGTFGWDDEGVAGARTPLVVDGVLRAALSDRESAAALGLDRSGGCARADGFARQPIVRMTNVSLEPGGAGTLEDLRPTPARASTWRRIARGPSTTGGCSSSSPPRSPARSAAGSSGGSTGTPCTPG